MTTESTISSKQSHLVAGFASLLSSALNVSGSAVNQPLQSSANKLPKLIASSQEGVCCTVPSLKLQKRDSAFCPRSSKPLLEDAAATNLRHPIEVNRKQLSSLPMTLLWNLSKSFMSLVDSRLHSSLTALVRQSRGDNAFSQVLVGLLSHSSNPISPTTVVTTFRTLAFSERTEEGTYAIPLIFEAIIDLNILQGNLIAFNVEAPGTIHGNFSCSSEPAGPVELLSIDISIDTTALLQSMMAQARIAVRRAVGLATETASELDLHQQSQRVVSSNNLQSAAAVAPLRASLPLSSAKSEPVADVQRNSNRGDGDAKSSVAKAENPLMPPPPARAPGHGSHEHDRAGVARSTQTNVQNPTWNTNDESNSSRLSLLTVALGGLKREHPDEEMQNNKTRRSEETGSQHKQMKPKEQDEKRTESDEAVSLNKFPV